MKNDEYFMNLALEEAKIAMQEGEVPIGAILVKGDDVISKAHNQKEKLKNATAHAEILLIQNASKTVNNWRFSGYRMYVTLEPCAMCASAIQQARIDEVIYALKDPNNGAIESGVKLYKTKNINNPPKVKSGICAEQSSELLKDFFKNRRKQ